MHYLISTHYFPQSLLSLSAPHTIWKYTEQCVISDHGDDLKKGLRDDNDSEESSEENIDDEDDGNNNNSFNPANTASYSSAVPSVPPPIPVNSFSSSPV
ncbi:hypothetical protein L5515_009275 [Caenorhabditis briggsae]|uniref:Uncharacterized protein n=1 Tax=Caenorhabditis briggsae TaxID=6238 RepID=A0AAE9F3N3_CAEBR|nr:hypothetical protein L5515_009275 [Caenorhabditis briggsae]